MISKMVKIFRNMLIVISYFVMGLLVAGLYLYAHLPDISSLKKVTYQEPLKVYSRDGVFLATFGEVHRVPIKIERVPEMMIQALLITEDQRFFKHHGIDIYGLLRAVKSLVNTGKKSQGASTITMQVARNFFLGREKTYLRKINEILLALAIEKSLSKRDILELYLNKIYFGHRAYGIVAAANNYFDKDLDQLTLSEIAILAGLPKAPSDNNPIRNKHAAMMRRNFILKRMYDHHIINAYQYHQALEEAIVVKEASQKQFPEAGYVAEMARQAMFKRFGEKAYHEGYRVYVTANSEKQKTAQYALAKGLDAYDKKQGYRKSTQNLLTDDTFDIDAWKNKLKRIASTPLSGKAAAVLAIAPDYLLVYTANGERLKVDISHSCWLTTQCQDQDSLLQTSDLPIAEGDVVMIVSHKGQWSLTQVPIVQGALVAINPLTCQLDAMMGGYQFERSHFNRATQAYRQPGSAIKPFLYAMALEHGYTMASMINDSPIIEEDITGDNAIWRPKNVDALFKGPIRLRQALIQSRNLVSIRLTKAMGISKTRQFLDQAGFEREKQVHGLSLSLGTGLVTPIQLAQSFSIFPNQGTLCQLEWLLRVEDRHGNDIASEKDLRALEDLVIPQKSTDKHKTVIRKETAYIIGDALRDVVKYGTARGAKVLSRNDICGKTGSTNDHFDAWFSGFNQDSIVSVWVGFDNAKDLKMPGSKLALPIWIDYMRSTLLEEKPLMQPANIISMRINRNTGQPAEAEDTNTMFELFIKGEEPERLESHQVQKEHEIRENIFE